MLQLLDITTVSGFSLRLLTAIFLGLMVGFERQWTKHQAGILTNVIVCVGAFSYSAFSYIAGKDNIDVTRIAAQIVCGIGFLGAGLILRDGTNIRGLSTAATIWATAAIGILCTVDNILYAILVAFSIVILHLVLHPLSSHIDKLRHYNKKSDVKSECFYNISIKCNEDYEVEIRSKLVKTIREKNGVLLHNLESVQNDDGYVKIKAYISTVKKNNDMTESILAHIGKYEGIISAGWKLDN